MAELADSSAPVVLVGSAHRGVRSRLRRYGLAFFFVLLAAPLTIYATYRSTAWIGTTFPAFLLMDNRVVPTVSGYDWPPGKADVFHTRVLAVEGAPVTSSGAVYGLVARHTPGTEIEYTFRKGGRVFTRSIATRRFSFGDYLQVYGILLAIGFLNLGLGAVVGWLQPDRRSARVYVLLSLAGCLFAVTPVFLHQQGHAALTIVYLIAESMFPATFIHFAACFPVDRLADSAIRRRGVWIAYGIAAAIALWKLEGFYAEPPDLSPIYASYLYIAASFAAFFVSMWAAYRGEIDPRAQLRIRALIPSVTIGTGLCIFAFLNNMFSGGDFPLQLGLLLVPVFFASVAYAIVAHDLFGIDRFVRWTFIYVVLSLILYSGYTLIVSAAPAMARGLGSVPTILYGLGFVGLALALDPLRRLVQRLVDRAYYRTPWDYRATVSRVSREMTGWRSVERIMDELTRVLTAEMQLDAVTVCQWDGSAWSRVFGRELRRLEAPAGLGRWQRALGAAGELLLAHDFLDRAADHDSRGEMARFLADTQVVALLPLAFAGRVTGLLLLGPPRARRPLAAEDLDLLRTLADQAAIAIENARSYEALEEHNRTLNETVRQRTAQLIQSEQLASLGQLVAGVAHELNNPIGAVASSVENLRAQIDAVGRLLKIYQESAPADPTLRNRIEALQDELGMIGVDDTRDLLDICAEGSERVRGIVRDLLVFARVDGGGRVATDIVQGLDSTLRLLADRLDRASVRVVRDFRPVTSVVVNVAQLNQVWMNLLVNSLDALRHQPDPEIRVAVRPAAPADQGDGSPWIEVEIADNGAGMSADVRARIFEPFFTTKEIGKGTGLGMSIAYGAVREHGGAIAVESRDGHGTTVRVRLPGSTS